MAKVVDMLSKTYIAQGLTTSFVGREITLLPSVPSTNQYIKNMNPLQTGSGHVVIANGQSQGRGQKGRSFSSPPGQGIYMSILLKVDTAALNPSLLTLCTAVSVTRAIKEVCRLDTGIKWVNDIYCRGKKLCGILAQSQLSTFSGQPSTVVIGIGINTGTVAKEVADIATSILEETGLTNTRNQLIAQILNTFEALFIDFTVRDKKAEILLEYDQKLFIKGKKVLIEQENHRYTALVTGIDKDGALMVIDEQGRLCCLQAGRVHLSW